MTKSRIRFEKEKNRVIKSCRTFDEYNRELHIYRKKLNYTPSLIAHNEEDLSITISHLIGDTIYNIKNPDFKKLANLFYQFHSMEERNICLMDTNPNNIIYDHNTCKYYLLDFSEWEYNFKEFDLIHFLLFWAAIYTSDKFKKTAGSFLTEYNRLNRIDKSSWQNMLPQICTRFDNRRKKFKKKEKTENIDQDSNRLFLANYFL